MRYVWPIGLTLNGAMFASGIFGEADFTNSRGVIAALYEQEAFRGYYWN